MPYLRDHVDVLDCLCQRAQRQREAQQAALQREHQAVAVGVAVGRERSEAESGPPAGQQGGDEEGQAAAADAALQEAAACTSWAALPDDGAAAAAARQSTDVPPQPASGDRTPALTDSGLGECAPPVATAISASATATKGAGLGPVAGRSAATGLCQPT